MAEYYVRAAELAQDAMKEIAELEERLAEALQHRDEWREVYKGVVLRGYVYMQDKHEPADKLEWEK